jgi:RNA polymerase sigma-70 factor (ECF subfamily)
MSPPPPNPERVNDQNLRAQQVLELQWARRIREGDKSAFEAMFVAYYLKLRRFVIRFVQTQDAAEELVQDLFVDLWAKRETWEVRDSLRAYLYTAARNRALSQINKRNVEETWEDEELAQLVDPGRGPHEELDRQELISHVQKVIETLPARCRLILNLSRKDGLTYAEIAQVLGISIKTVETQMGRAFKMLRERLAGYLPLLSTLWMLNDRF